MPPPAVIAQAPPDPVVAYQNNGSPDYAVWEKLAGRVVDALEVGRASDVVMQDLRAEITAWRQAFSDAQAANAVRINTLKTQISTLGPPPAEGQTEPAILTQRRDELTALLNEARVPVQKAEEAHGRANALVGEIDSLLRARQTDLLFELGPTPPVNPAIWAGGAVEDVLDTLRGGAAVEVQNAWGGSETQRAELKRILPVVIGFGVIGALLVLRGGRAWVMRAGLRVRRRSKGGATQGVLMFLTSLGGQVVAPFLGGLVALLAALEASGVIGLRGQYLADMLANTLLLFFAALWLGTRVFGAAGGAPWAVLRLNSVAERAEGGRFNAALLGGVLFGLSRGLAELGGAYEDYSAETMAVLNFPLLLGGAGLLLVRMGGRLIRHSAEIEADPEEGSLGGFRAGTMKMLGGRVVVAVGYLGPVAAAIGYVQMAQTILFPTALTLWVLGLLLVLNQFFINLYGVVTGGADEEAANQALTPTLASFVTGLVALPFLSLIWGGARWTDLTELWTTVGGQGFRIGDTVLTPRAFLTFMIVFVVGYTLTRVVQGMLKSSILPRTKLDKGGQNAITSGLGYVGIFLAALVAITAAGIDMSSLAIVAGALSVGIGFGLQNIVSNFVSGIILLIERPISEGGDWIEVGGQMGYVRDISVRSTRLETFDRQDVILPNSDLISGVVTNYTRGNSVGRVIVPVGVAYGTDTRLVERLLMEVAEAHPMVTVNPAPSVVFQGGFGADALEFEIRAILRDVNYVLSVKSDMNHEIARRFTEEGLEIPFAQRDIWLRNPPEVLTGTRGDEATDAVQGLSPLHPLGGPQAPPIWRHWMSATCTALRHRKEKVMTDPPLFRDDAYLTEAEGVVLSHTDQGGVVLDGSLFYPTGGGQPGDKGVLRWDGGGEMAVATTVKGAGGDEIVLVPAEGGATLPPKGTQVTQILDWDTRNRHMRVHTALHLLSVVVPLPVTGGSIGPPEKGRLDFVMEEPPEDKQALEDALNALVARDLAVTEDWITEAELDANPGLVKTMSVKPPPMGGAGRVRLVRIGTADDQVDLQPCGGTHVARTGEIGRIRLGKVEKKGRMNRRFNLHLDG